MATKFGPESESPSFASGNRDSRIFKTFANLYDDADKPEKDENPSILKQVGTSFLNTLVEKATDTFVDKATNVVLSPLTGGSDTYDNNAAVWHKYIKQTIPKAKETEERMQFFIDAHNTALKENKTPDEAAYASMYEATSEQVTAALAQGKLKSATGTTLETGQLSTDARKILVDSLVKERMHANNGELLNQYHDLVRLAEKRINQADTSPNFNPLARSWFGKIWNSMQGETDETLIATGLKKFRESEFFETNLAAKKALKKYDANKNYETGVNVLETVAIQEHLNRISAAEYTESTAARGTNKMVDAAGNIVEVPGAWVQITEGDTISYKFIPDRNGVPKKTNIQQTEFTSIFGDPINQEIDDLETGDIYNRDTAGKFIVELNKTFGGDIRTLESSLANAKSPEEKEEVRQRAQRVLNAIAKWKTNGANLNTAYNTVEKRMYLKYLEDTAKRKASWKIKYEQELPPPKEGQQPGGGKWLLGKEYDDAVKAYKQNKLEALEEYEHMERDMVRIRAGFEAGLIHIDGVTAVPIGSKINERGETVSIIPNKADRNVNQRKFELWRDENRSMTDKEESDIRLANEVVEK